jgi:hypothetical protein
VIARSKDNLRLLLLLGYSPSWLSKKLTNQFIPVYMIIILLALAFTQLLHWGFYQYIMHNTPVLADFIHGSIIICAFILIVIAVWVNYRLVKKLLYKIS